MTVGGSEKKCCDDVVQKMHGGAYQLKIDFKLGQMYREIRNA